MFEKACVASSTVRAARPLLHVADSPSIAAAGLSRSAADHAHSVPRRPCCNELKIGVVMVIQKTNPNLYGNFSPTSAHIQKHCLHMHFYPNQPPELPWPG